MGFTWSHMTHRTKTACTASAETTAAPKPDAGASVSDPAKWVRVPALEGLRGIKKGTAYNLIHAGAIQSVRLPNTLTKATPKNATRKSTKGVRLVFLPSVDNYLNRLLQEQAPVKDGVA